MAVTEGRKKKPPTFHYLPKSRAKRLKKSWIEDHKIRSKWRAQKKREGLTNQIDVSAEDTSNHCRDETSAHSESTVSPSRPDKLPTPPHQKQSLRDLRELACASKPLCTRKADSACPKGASGHSHRNGGGKLPVGREMGQPNMKLRMSILLEKIKRDFS